jgi:hypothetical protein
MDIAACGGEWMEYKKAKAYLDGILSARLNIAKLEASIARVRFDLEHPLSAVNYDRDKVQSSPSKDTLEKQVIRYMELLGKHEALYVERKTALERKLYEAELKIMKLPDGKPRDFLLRHYIDGVSEIDYAVEAGYETTSSVYKLRIRAIKLFAAWV